MVGEDTEAEIEEALRPGYWKWRTPSGGQVAICDLSIDTLISAAQAAEIEDWGELFWTPAKHLVACVRVYNDACASVGETPDELTTPGQILDRLDNDLDDKPPKFEGDGPFAWVTPSGTPVAIRDLSIFKLEPLSKKLDVSWADFTQSPILHLKACAQVYALCCDAVDEIPEPFTTVREVLAHLVRVPDDKPTTFERDGSPFPEADGPTTD